MTFIESPLVERISRLWWLLILSPLLIGVLDRFLEPTLGPIAILSIALLMWLGVALGILRAKRNGYTLWACFALLFAVLGGLLGIVFGAIALFKIRRNPKLKGKGLAIVAIIIAIPVALVFLFFQNLDPERFLPTQAQLEPYCAEACQEEPDYSAHLLELNPTNSSEYICSCLDTGQTILAQYVIPADYLA
jgi:hypothetical protein